MIINKTMSAAALLMLVSAVSVQAQEVAGDPRITEHYVPVVSSSPAMGGFVSQLYVRERTSPGTDSRDQPNRVILFVHGAGTPAEVAFDTSAKGYSWMDYLARRGFDTFSVDLTGYGRSTRPLQMNDRCNLSADQQQTVFGSACEATFKQGATTLASDWDDLDAVVNYLLKLRNVATVDIVA